jgi:hypothetical protein
VRDKGKGPVKPRHIAALGISILFFMLAVAGCGPTADQQYFAQQKAVLDQRLAQDKAVFDQDLAAIRARRVECMASARSGAEEIICDHDYQADINHDKEHFDLVMDKERNWAIAVGEAAP